jgi:hypothetical protein
VVGERVQRLRLPLHVDGVDPTGAAIAKRSEAHPEGAAEDVALAPFYAVPAEAQGWMTKRKAERYVKDVLREACGP